MGCKQTELRGQERGQTRGEGRHIWSSPEVRGLLDVLCPALCLVHCGHTLAQLDVSVTVGVTGEKQRCSRQRREGRY